MQAQPNFGASTHVATLKGKRVEFEIGQYDEAIAWLIAQAGGYDASFHVVGIEPPRNLPTPVDATDTIYARATRVARIESDAAAAVAAGFTLADPLYALGRKVNDLGVANAQASRVAYDAKPTVVEAAATFIDRVAAERRKDATVRVRDLGMSDAGDLVVPTEARGIVGLGLGESAFESLVARTGIGGAGYLKSCWPALRSLNVNLWTQRIAQREDAARAAWTDAGRKGPEPKPASVVLRCRSTAERTRAVYAIVSTQYRALDCDVIARAIAAVAPPDARGSIVYDGQRTRFEVLFHSDVAADDYGCGEIFRAGVIVTTNDVGDGSIRVSAMVERNLCLNLIVLDTSEQQVAGIRHVGAELESKFNAAFADALDKLHDFRDAWGYARADQVATPAAMASGEDLSTLTAREVLAGIAWAQMRRELVPVRGRKPEVLRDVLRAYDREAVKTDVLARTDVVNAWTRYAHETASLTDPWIEDDIQAAAGRLLQNRKPLPYEKVPFAF
jgi:hypothetical protein